MAGAVRIFRYLFETISAFACRIIAGRHRIVERRRQAIVIATMFIGKTGIFAHGPRLRSQRRAVFRISVRVDFNRMSRERNGAIFDRIERRRTNETVCNRRAWSLRHQDLEELLEITNEIIIIDRDKDVIEKYKDFARASYITDAINETALRKIVPPEIDAVIVDLGGKIESSIMTINFLHKMGIREIVAKAQTDEHGEILKLMGATKVIYPDREAAKRITPILASSLLFDFMPISQNLSLAEIRANEYCIGNAYGSESPQGILPQRGGAQEGGQRRVHLHQRSLLRVRERRRAPRRRSRRRHLRLFPGS